MAYEIPVLIRSKKAAADLSAKQYTFVKLDANGDIAAISAATDVPYGVLQNAPDAAGKTAEVMVEGVSKVYADGTVGEGDLVGPSADGQADTKVPGTDTTNYVGGQAETAGAAGEIISVKLAPVPFRAS